MESQFSEDVLRQIIREELTEVMGSGQTTRNQLPPLLTREEMKQLLRIKDTKASELLARADFPVCRAAGVLIFTDKLFEWLEQHADVVC